MSKIYVESSDPFEARYTFYGKTVPSVTQILSGVSLYPDYSVLDQEKLAEKQEIGTSGHSYVAATFLEKPRVRKKIRSQGSARLNAYLDTFDYWFNEFVEDFEPIAVEKQLHYLTVFAGTPDYFGLMKLRGDPIAWRLMDWKFRDKTILGDRLQTMAYKWMASRTYKEEFSGPVERSTVLIPEGKIVPHRVIHSNDNDDWLDFQAALRVFTLRWKHKLL
jgi:hypothetical protein